VYWHKAQAARSVITSAPLAIQLYLSCAENIGLLVFGLGLEPAGDADAGDGVVGGDFA
jgi:hypothetical protein